MKAVILVGGKGTRLRPLTCNTPKPILPVLNRPLLEHVVEYLARHGVKEIVLAVSYLPEMVREVMGDGSRFGVRLLYVTEREPLGTSGAVKNAQEFLNEPFFVFNGDILTRIDLTDMMRRHRQVKPKVTISLVPVDNPTIYGVVETDERGMVTRFVEKPTWDKVTSNRINAGIYVVDPEVLAMIPPNAHSMFETFVFPKLLEMKEPVLSYPSRAYWMDVGTPEKYLRGNHDLLREKGNQIFKEGECVIDPQAVLHPPVLMGAGCRIGKAEITGPVVLGAGCEIADGARIQDCVLRENAYIGEGSFLKDCAISCDCRIEEGCHLEDCVLGDGVVIERGVKELGARIPPNSTVSATPRKPAKR